MSNERLVIHIFRRDLRIVDNNALSSLEKDDILIPLFIINPHQITNHKYFSKPGLGFMLESLRDLSDSISKLGGRLYIGYGEIIDVIDAVLKQIKSVTKNITIQINRDYTPFSIDRDARIEEFCNKNGIEFQQYNDLLLTEPEQIRKGDGGSYSVFSAFARRAKSFLPASVSDLPYYNFYQKLDGFDFDEHLKNIDYDLDINPRIRGGRKEGLALLERVGELSNYDEERDIPALDRTTHLSAHNKFGTISIREFFWKVVDLFGFQHTLINELYWRDFFTHVAFNNPHVFKGAYRSKYDKIDWRNDEDEFDKWCKGETGFPIVDAGMRELNQTGYMHNRVRMITASFLVKDLHIDWHWGEQYFARHLIDYDPSVNNGNWQWAASTGCDAQPYFRIFNPWRQQKRFDSDCFYIKQWIPELKDVSATIMNNPELLKEVKGYFKPICDHKSRAEEAKRMFKEISE